MSDLGLNNFALKKLKKKMKKRFEYIKFKSVFSIFDSNYDFLGKFKDYFFYLI